MASTISRKTGIQVYAKTLKTALGKQAWVVVFDGLDEVPNDHKDEISKEVIYFVNDNVFEIDADVLTICTSRPQGYSGQFAALDGAEVLLVRLDPNQALACAAPLLKFARAPDEAEKSIGVLEAAIKSPNIQQLMTTPLQAHIMAIVVREGGKPPERRWRLFQSFYQVMKRRESLKDFKDPRVAALLQGEDRLLRAVHMRLGFVLHARAERSSGAQTVLSRQEFRELVSYVVRDLGAEDIDETIDVLMEATTERLVLVSTPDNGDQVRFDIRQLQEFFAAEFIYDGVSSSDLAFRIETIGGDAHWREVMHFLLSALIADRRTNEVAIAIQELQKLNDGDSQAGDCLYRRRQGAGSRLVSRLLTEGVLEDDQKDRRNVKTLISGIGSVHDFALLRSLSSMRLRNSRQWIIDLFIERVKTSAAAESVGALFMLGWLLPDGHSEESLCLNAFEQVSPIVRSAMYEQWCIIQSQWTRYKAGRQEAGPSKQLSRWTIVSAVQALNSGSWLHLPLRIVPRIVELLRESGDQFGPACVDAGIGPEAAASISKSILTEDTYVGKGTNAEPIDCGLISAAPYECNWLNGRLPPGFKDINAVECVSVLDGYFKLCMKCILFAQKRNADVMRDLFEELSRVPQDRLITVPKMILALIPVVAWHQLDSFSLKFLSVSVENVPKYLNFVSEEISPPLEHLHVQEFSEEICDAWVKMSKKLPKLAVRIALADRDSPLSLAPVVFVEELRNVMVTSPKLMAEDILRWGVLSEKEPELLQGIKQSVCEATFRTFDSLEIIDQPIDPFVISLPADAPLLPILATAFARWRQGDREVAFTVAEGMDTGHIDQILLAYELTPKLLRECATDPRNSRLVRAGAIALYWFCASSRDADAEDWFLDIRTEAQIFNDLVDAECQVWLTRALVEGVLGRVSEVAPGGIEVVQSLLIRDTRGEMRTEILRLLRIWRERSTAPVSALGLLGMWLGYGDTTPSYALVT